MPAGDSITDGFRLGGGCYLSGADSQTAYQGGYRIPLGKMLPAGSFTYVGPHSNGPAGMAGGNNHAGACGAWIGGAVIDKDSPQNDISGRIDWQNWPQYDPDIVLLMIGTNDYLHSGTTQAAMAARVSALVDKFNAKMPNAVVVVATIIPNGGNVTELNNGIRTAAKAKMAAGKKVRLVDMDTVDLNLSTDYRVNDSVHPSDKGYAKMANGWYPAVKAIMSGGVAATPTVTTTPTPIRTPTPTILPATKGDLNGDTKVNVLDLSTLLSSWGTSAGDLNGDGKTNVLDLSTLLSSWKP